MSNNDLPKAWETEEELDAMLGPGMLPSRPADPCAKPVIDVLGGKPDGLDVVPRIEPRQRPGE